MNQTGLSQKGLIIHCKFRQEDMITFADLGDGERFIIMLTPGYANGKPDGFKDQNIVFTKIPPQFPATDGNGLANATSFQKKTSISVDDSIWVIRIG